MTPAGGTTAGASGSPTAEAPRPLPSTDIGAAEPPVVPMAVLADSRNQAELVVELLSRILHDLEARPWAYIAPPPPPPRPVVPVDPRRARAAEAAYPDGAGRQPFDRSG